MKDVTAVDEIICIDDGDNIIPSMGMVFPNSGTQYYGNNQYYDPATYECTPDFRGLNIGYYPNNYSSAGGVFVTPDNGVTTWYMNSINDNNIIAKSNSDGTFTIPDKKLSGGGTWAAYSSIFRMANYEFENGKYVPCLYICGNFPPMVLTNVNFYCVGYYNGIRVVSHGVLEISPKSDNSYRLLIVSTNNATKADDSAINTADEKLTLHAELQHNGIKVDISGDDCAWYKLDSGGTYVKVTSVSGLSDLTVGEGDIDGVAEYMAKVTHNNTVYQEIKTLGDTQDPYYVNIGRTVNDDATAGPTVKKADIIKYAPSVIVRSSGALAPGTWKYDFKLYGYDKPTELYKSAASVDTYSFTGSDAYTKGGIHVLIYAKKQ